MPVIMADPTESQFAIYLLNIGCKYTDCKLPTSILQALNSTSGSIFCSIADIISLFCFSKKRAAAGIDPKIHLANIFKNKSVGRALIHFLDSLEQ